MNTLASRKGQSALLTSIDVYLEGLLYYDCAPITCDNNLWLGIILAVCGLFLLVYLICTGEAVRGKVDGWAYSSENFFYMKTIGFALWRLGVNFILLVVAVHNEDQWISFHCYMVIPALIVSLEKTIFMYSFTWNRWIDQHYFIKRTSYTCTSSYEQFSKRSQSCSKFWMLTSLSVVQASLILFYLVALQDFVTDLHNGKSQYPFVFWVIAFPLQQVADWYDFFGKDFHMMYWACMVYNAGKVEIEQSTQVGHGDASTVTKTKPSKLAVYWHFFLAWTFEMFGRNLLLMTLPVFLMSSKGPADFIFNCVAVGFIPTISRATSGTYYLRSATEDRMGNIESELSGTSTSQITGALLNTQATSGTYYLPLATDDRMGDIERELSGTSASHITDALLNTVLQS